MAISGLELTREFRRQQQATHVIECARRLVKVADEFWPEYPGAIDEPLSNLDGALNKLSNIDSGEEPRNWLRE
jgi:hypothetical protein